MILEVMGRDAGFIALHCAIGGGAELVLIPEMLTNMDNVRDNILSMASQQSRSSIIVVAEGEESGGAVRLADRLSQDAAFDHIDLRVCILGHTQRGGSPNARDRVLASRLGSEAVLALLQGHANVMVGMVNNDIKFTPMREVWSRKKNIDYELLSLCQVLN